MRRATVVFGRLDRIRMQTASTSRQYSSPAIRPDLNFDYLLDEENTEKIRQNIRERKGVGDIDACHRKWKKVESIISQETKGLSEEEYKKIWDELYDEALLIPNTSHPNSPRGGESNNEVVCEWGAKREGDALATAEKIAHSWRGILHPTDACGQRSYAFLGAGSIGAQYQPHRMYTTATPNAKDTVEESSVEAQGKALNLNSSKLPNKETLLRMDWLLEHQAPLLLKSRIKPLFDACLNEVVFEDNVFNYQGIKSKNALLQHIAKLRMYFRYKSPFNKVEHLGSCVYEGDDVVVVLWRLSTLESSLMSYFPSFITKKEPKVRTVEGALDVHISQDGYIYKIVNRKVTASDREGAKVMREFKEQAEEKRRREAEKEARREAEVL